MKYRIAQIIPYFGKWPKWIDLYLYSCAKNPIIDFIFYTDCPIPIKDTKNIIFNKCTYQEYSKLISKRLNIQYNNPNPYKLTDLKPFIGYIHEEELEKYDFWGFGDIDLVYGDLSKLINDKILEKYDIITTHNYHIAGHFCLCKNNEYYRNLCFKIKEWKIKITSNDHYALDEGSWSGLVCPYLKLERRLHKYIFRHIGLHLFTVLDKLNPILHKKILLKEYWTSPAPQIGQKWYINCKNIKIYDYKNRELPYLHFLFFKKTPWLETDLYWRDHFYKISPPISKYSKIYIDNNCILGIECDKE